MTIPQTMRHVAVDGAGGPEVMRVAEGPVPKPGPGEVLIQVLAAGVNRPDVAQRQGAYPPPPGASPLLGLEVAGEIAQLGDGVEGWRVGDKVCALAEYAGYLLYKDKGAPIAFVAPPDGLPATPVAAGVVSKAPHPEAAQLFIDWQLFPPRVHYGDYYQLLTSAFLHLSPLHIAANMLALALIGPALERLLGPVRFAALYLIGAIGGGALVYAFEATNTPTAGASGAIFAMFGACLVLVRRTPRIVEQHIFARRSRWIWANAGRTPGVTKRPPDETLSAEARG